MRDYLEVSRQPLGDRPAGEIARVLAGLWERRKAREETLGSFVADNSSLDFVAYALYYRCQDQPAVRTLLQESVKRLQDYHGCVVLPFAGIPYVADGVRPASQGSQSRYQNILEELYARHGGATPIHSLPLNCATAQARMQWALAHIAEERGRATEGKERLRKASELDPKSEYYRLRLADWR
jgi:hypothetical protein